MKMIIAVVNIGDAANVNKALIESDFKATRMNTIGAFFKGRNETFLIGINDERVPTAINVIEKAIPKKKSLKVVAVDDNKFDAVNSLSIKSNATIFVLNVDMFLKV